MPNNIHIIYNPAAGKGNAGRNLAAVRALLGQRLPAYSLALTAGPGHARELSRQAAEAGCSAVVAAGGDGTVNEVINGLMEAHTGDRPRPALGVLPVGRGNDFAFGAGLPMDTPGAVQVLAAGRTCKIDLGRVISEDFPTGRYFGNGIGLGFDTVVTIEAGKLKRIKGALSYLAAVMKTVFLYSHAPVYDITLDGVTTRQPCLLVSVMNGRRMGGAFLMAPKSIPTDGLFDLCLAGQVSQPGIFLLVPRFINGSQAGHPAITMARAQRVEVRAVKGSIPAHADGEILCEAGKQLAVEIVPAALDVLTLAHLC